MSFKQAPLSTRASSNQEDSVPCSDDYGAAGVTSTTMKKVSEPLCATDTNLLIIFFGVTNRPGVISDPAAATRATQFSIGSYEDAELGARVVKE